MAAKKGGGWGSVFSSAVAGLESRLDTILAEDNEASAKARAEREAHKTLGVPAAPSDNRDARTRANDRLAERLAKVTAAKASPRNQSPAKPSPRPSQDGKEVDKQEEEAATLTEDVAVEVKEERPDVASSVEQEQDDVKEEHSAIPPITLPLRPSVESSARPSIDIPRSEVSSRPSTEFANGSLPKSSIELQAALGQQREEMHIYLEKIDALQAKLTYLAQQTVAAAKEVNASSPAGSQEGKLAEKDEQIAQLMQEGEKLSKAELRHLQTIKKLRLKATEEEKMGTETKRKLERAEQAEKELKQKLRRAEVAERQASDKAKQISAIEKQVDELKVDRENASELVRSLTTQLKEAKEHAERVERDAKEKVNEADKGRIATLENDLEDAQIERKLAETRAEAEVKKIREDLEGQKQRFSVRELELKNEMSSLETRVEAMRSRAEEASADGGVSGESSIKLLRQVETLQSQYALAKENWETIEGSLNARLVALEKERDESGRRETEARKRAREAAVRARKAEEDGESEKEKTRDLEVDIRTQREELESLRSKLERSESSQTDAKAELERQKQQLESEFAQRLEDERIKWQQNQALSAAALPPQTPTSPLTSRKASNHYDTRRPLSRMVTSELTTPQYTLDSPRPVSRRSWTSAFSPQPKLSPQQPSPPVLSRQESTFSLDRNNSFPIQTPTIEIDTHDLAPDEAFEMPPAPDTGPQSPDFNGATFADLVSTSTAPTSGPSVQLMERMSALVRRLETEKAATKDELQRLTSQRDSARDEIVSLMREVDAKRDAEATMKRVEGEMKVLEERYEASLEMLGEREEEAEELRGDVRELKRLYRELVEEKLGSGKPAAR
ncbi:TATA element modulatory factor 1 TATA binding-domain-containing protein [Neohortaea acidophila]|uniref:TATA element modulatory factor 1 TATA binding-domain-containing protein n=1 Tax=Neohortaea acidophila TaxID=245834 RepID=A0A6A6Q5M1_9PEZI|nr:TATA element modulatory factor 1 TATA binding-domain-containing protein [Neohortaea acidophila]KAF2486933.1 TATA element modulatory factor 1 TATA binding-domain-containing protein [Neohortaea acidophila]